MLTRQGWAVSVVALVLLVVGRLFSLLELYVAAVALGALVGLSVLAMATRSLSIQVDREVHPPKLHAGGSSRVDLLVRNTGRRRAPVLALRDGVSGTRGAHLLVPPLAPGEQLRAAYRLPTTRRGILRIGPLDVELTDVFGLARSTIRASGVTEVTVYPHVDDVAPVPLTSGTDPHAGAEHPNSLGRSGEDFYALRSYVVGDDLRRVHWPSTARHDELMVRQDELPWQSRSTILLDTRSSTAPPDVLEDIVSAAASIVTAGAARQDLLRMVVTDGTDSGFAAGSAHVDGIMEHLACLGPSGDGLASLVDRLSRSATGGSLVCLVGTTSAAELAMLRRLRNRFGSVTVIRFDTTPQAAPGRGTVLSVEGSFATTWNRAFRRRAA